ncbi:MAG: acyl-CoA carboxylase subunit epsilon [Sciscionella sp.]
MGADEQVELEAAAPRPLLRVVRGTPDEAELAALTTIVATLGSDAQPATDSASPSRWADRAALVRAPLHAGPGAWRASALPH